MRGIVIVSVAFLLASCSGGEGGDDTVQMDSGEAAPSGSSAPAEISAKLPFDMPIMPGARYLSGGDFVSLKRGQEAIATIIAKGTPLDVVKYYEKALVENGFKPTPGYNNSDSTANVSGIRGDGEKFSVTSMSGGSKAGPGESQTAIIATKPNAP